ncbi:YIP1 family protein [Methanoregula sp.]|uniref:YIP1 family protein n=1 Tax=Methanoregula sp. TaxID=2052170 RepID=UPI00236C5DD3|nr:YIP1 family protein [Methanoregula sp.]MDD1686356.1 YIP1 family protein [Methanoregula sp.]
MKGFLLNPVETFRQSKTEDLTTVFSYFGVLLLIDAILTAVIAAFGIENTEMFAGLSLGVAVPILVFFMMLIGGFIVTFILAAWIHLWVYILGGRKGIMQTVNAVIYGSTPRMLLGWIPFIGIIFLLWSLVLSVLGIRELQELSTGKAILAVVIAVIIPLILLVLLAAWLYSSVMTVTAVPVVPAYS